MGSNIRKVRNHELLPSSPGAKILMGRKVPRFAIYSGSEAPDWARRAQARLLIPREFLHFLKILTMFE